MHADDLVLLEELLPDDGPAQDPGAGSVLLTVPEWVGGAGPAPAVRRDHEGVRAVELPAVEDPPPPVEGLGGRSAAWAAGYRDGHVEGRNDGYAEGYATGLAEGGRRAQDEADQRWAGLSDRVDAVLAAQDRRIGELAGEVLELAVELAGLVVGHQVATSADPGADALRRAVAAAPPGPPLLARLHPDDLERLAVDVEGLAPGRRLDVVADPSVATGDCRIEAGPTVVDASLGAALARVRAVLLDDAVPGATP